MKNDLSLYIENKVLLIQNGFPCGNWNKEGKGVLQLRPFNVTSNGTIDLSEKKYIEVNKNINLYLLQKGDVIFTNTNSENLVGRTSLWSHNEKSVLSNHMSYLRVLNNNRLNAHYLSFLLHYLWIIGFSRTICRRHVNQASISLDKLRSIKISTSDVSEQRKIATILSTVQKAIENQAKLIERTTELKKAMMHKLFTEGTRGEKQKMTEIGPVPESWEVVRLGKYAQIKNGYAFKSKDYCKNGVLSVRISNVSHGILIDKDNKYLPENYLHKYTDYSLKVGDLILSLTRPIISTGMKYCFIKQEHLPLLLNQRVGKFEVLDSSMLINEYLFFVVFSKYFTDELKKLFGNSSQQPNVSPIQLGRFLIPLPSIEEQKEIAEYLSSIDQKISLHTRKKQKLEELFRTLLHQLMTAQIRVNDIDISFIEEME